MCNTSISIIWQQTLVKQSILSINIRTNLGPTSRASLYPLHKHISFHRWGDIATSLRAFIGNSSGHSSLFSIHSTSFVKNLAITPKFTLYSRSYPLPLPITNSKPCPPPVSHLMVVAKGGLEPPNCRI